MFAGTFSPQGWAFCDGTLLFIQEFDTLFQVIGTTYGGNGVNNFALPDLRSRIPLHMGQAQGLSRYILAQNGGVESVTLVTGQLPAHTHSLTVSGAPGTASSPRANSPGASPSISIYRVGAATDALAQNALPTYAGQNQPHSNIQPLQAINFIISLFGIFPPPQN